MYINVFIDPPLANQSFSLLSACTCMDMSRYKIAAQHSPINETFNLQLPMIPILRLCLKP